MVGLGPICQKLVFAARPEYLSLIYNYMSGCPKYKGTTCLHIRSKKQQGVDGHVGHKGVFR